MLSIAFIFIACLLVSNFSAISTSVIDRICAASNPAFVAPALPIATVATGTPPGICTIDNNESRPYMMTATIVDEMTDTPSDKFQECKGQGIANIASGFMGGMAGCAMIGQSMINVKSGGLTRLSTFSAGIFLLILVVFISDWLKVIPMAALVAVMIMVSIGTFEWRSLTEFRQNPQSSNVVMIATVIVVVATHNLALGVLTGVLLSALFLANKLENDIRVESSLEGTHRLYDLHGQIFFSSSEKFMQGFDFKEDVKEVIIDLTHAHIWDVTSVAMLDSVVSKFQKNGINVTVRGLNEASTNMIDKYGTHAKI